MGIMASGGGGLGGWGCLLEGKDVCGLLIAIWEHEFLQISQMDLDI